MSSKSQPVLHRGKKQKRNLSASTQSTAMPAITIFIPFVMALSVSYRTLDSDDLIHSPKELHYRGASDGPVQFVDRARDCKKPNGQLLIAASYYVWLVIKCD